MASISKFTKIRGPCGTWVLVQYQNKSYYWAPLVIMQPTLTLIFDLTTFALKNVLYSALALFVQKFLWLPFKKQKIGELDKN